MAKTQGNQSGEKVLAVLDILLRNFAVGFTNGELSQATGFAQCDITRYVLTLEKSGFAERIPETNRIRPSHRLAQRAMQIMQSLDAAKGRIDSSISRITKEL